MDVRFAVLRHLKALEYGDLTDGGAYLSGDLVFHSTLKDFGKKETLRLMQAVLDAFPDMEIKYSDVIVRGKLVQLDLQISGTHKDVLQLNLPGIKPVAPTGRKVVLPKQRFVCRVENDQVAEVFPEVNPEAGLLGILKQVGAKVPPVWWMKLMWNTAHVLKLNKEVPA